MSYATCTQSRTRIYHISYTCLSAPRWLPFILLVTLQVMSLCCFCLAVVCCFMALMPAGTHSMTGTINCITTKVCQPLGRLGIGVYCYIKCGRRYRETPRFPAVFAMSTGLTGMGSDLWDPERITDHLLLHKHQSSVKINFCFVRQLHFIRTCLLTALSAGVVWRLQTLKQTRK